MSRRKLVSFLLLLAVAIAATSASPEAPESEVGPAQENASDHSNGSLTGIVPENDAANDTDEALDYEEALESEEDSEAEMATDNTNWPLTGVDPRTDVADETEETPATDDELETNFHFENEKASDDVITPSDGLRIVNGVSASIREHPYMVALWYQIVAFCGGSIISDRWVLTAAHCFDNKSMTPTLFTITAGCEYLHKGWRYNVSFIGFHPQYNTENMDYDAALVRITSLLNFNSFVNSIPLTQKTYPRVGTSAVASGWGRLYTNGPFPKRLQSVEVTIYSLPTCRKRTGMPLTDRMLCAGYFRGRLRRGTCGGDSGGPLVSGGEQVGIDSHHRLKTNCTEAPTIYTNVYYLLSWINSATGLKI